MNEVAVRLGVNELIAAYVDCIDDDRLEDWPDFFVEQCRYVVTSRASHEAGLQHGVIYAASRGMLIDRMNRVYRENRDLAYEALRDRLIAEAKLVRTEDMAINQAIP